MKCLRAVVCTHTVNLHYHEAQFREPLSARGEGFGHKRTLRSCIDIFNDGIFLPRIEVGWLVDHAPDIGLVIPALGNEDLRCVPSCFDQFVNVALLKNRELLVILHAIERHGGRLIDRGPSIDVIFAVSGVFEVMVAFRLGERSEPGSIKVDAIGMHEIGIFAGPHAAGLEPDLALVVVDAIDGAHDPFAPGDLILDFARLAIEQIEMRPSVAL